MGTYKWLLLYILLRLHGFLPGPSPGLHCHFCMNCFKTPKACYPYYFNSFWLQGNTLFWGRPALYWRPGLYLRISQLTSDNRQIQHVLYRRCVIYTLFQFAPFVEMPAGQNQPHSSSEQIQTEVHRALTDFPVTGGCVWALHITSKSLTLPNQPVLYSEGHSVPTDYQTIPSGAQALFDVSSTPDMRDVDELVVPAVAARWQWVALWLGVKRCISEIVLKTHPYNCEGACQDTLDCWLKGKQHTGVKEQTWSTLLTVRQRWLCCAGEESAETSLPHVTARQCSALIQL